VINLSRQKEFCKLYGDEKLSFVRRRQVAAALKQLAKTQISPPLTCRDRHLLNGAVQKRNYLSFIDANPDPLFS
jgi:hypothetical protein